MYFQRQLYRKCERGARVIQKLLSLFGFFFISAKQTGEQQGVYIGGEGVADHQHKNLHTRKQVEQADDKDMDGKQGGGAGGVGERHQEGVFDRPEAAVLKARHQREDVEQGTK